MIHAIDVWRKWVPDQERFQYVYGLRDFHMQNSPTCKAHRKKLLKLFDNCDKSEIGFVVEDLYGGVGEIPHFDEVTKLYGQQSLFMLSHLEAFLREKGFDVFNAECRHLLMCAHLVSTYTPSVPEDRLDYPLIGSDFLRDFDKLREEINSYNDGATLQAYYDSVLNKVSELYKSWFPQAEADQSIWDRPSVDCNMFLWRMVAALELVDVRALHALSKMKDKRKVVLCMGASHVQNIGKMLEKNGYERVGLLEHEPTLQDKLANFKNVVLKGHKIYKSINRTDFNLLLDDEPNDALRSHKINNANRDWLAKATTSLSSLWSR